MDWNWHQDIFTGVSTEWQMYYAHSNHSKQMSFSQVIYEIYCRLNYDDIENKFT